MEIFITRIFRKTRPELFIQLQQDNVTKDESIPSANDHHYRCAKVLLEHPEMAAEINPLTVLDHGMIFSAACELCWPLPEMLWKHAWRMDPWIGLGMTDMARAQRIMKDRNYNPVLNPIAENSLEYSEEEITKEFAAKYLHILTHVFRKNFDKEARLMLLKQPDIARVTVETWLQCLCNKFSVKSQGDRCVKRLKSVKNVISSPMPH